METEKAIEKLKHTIEQCHSSKECWENEQCCDCYVEVEDIVAIETILQEFRKQEKMIDKMADEILELNTMIVEKGELFSVVPMWLGKEHIIEYFKGITNKKAEESK